MADNFTPTPEHRFTFGLWSVEKRGRDPFGVETRQPLDSAESVYHFAKIGASDVNFHDENLVPFGSVESDRETALMRFRKALNKTGMKVPMATTNLFEQPVF